MHTLSTGVYVLVVVAVHPCSGARGAAALSRRLAPLLSTHLSLHLHAHLSLRSSGAGGGPALPSLSGRGEGLGGPLGGGPGRGNPLLAVKTLRAEVE